MRPDIFRIVYCSRSAMGSDNGPFELQQILAASRRNNARHGITGALLYNEGVFAQTLEGPFEAVQAIFEQIQADERHVDIVLLQAEPVGTRLFAEWAMALAEPEDPARAAEVVSRALGRDGPGGREVLMLLELLLRREPDWLAVA